MGMYQLSLAVAVILAVLFGGCNNLKKTPTEYEYLNYCSTKSDSMAILDSLNHFLEQRSEAYYYLKNDDVQYVKIHIDEILCSPKGEKFIVFVITQDTITNLLAPDLMDSEDYTYSGNCFIGQKDSTNTYIKSIKLFSQINIGYMNSYKEAIEFLKHMYHKELSSYRNEKGEFLYYNVNDIRFWECQFWERYFPL